MFESICTSQVAFNWLKERAEKYSLDGYPECDADMIEAIQKLNSLPGVVTAFCCSSHPERDEWQFYIAMGVRPEGLPFIEKLFAQMREGLSEVEHLSEDEYRSTRTLLTLGFGTLYYPNDSGYYNTVTLETSCMSVIEKEQVLSCLYTVLGNLSV